MRILKDLWAIIVILILMAICATALCQRNTAVRSLDRCKAEVERQEIVIDALETMCRFQAEDINRQNIASEAYQALIDKLLEKNSLQAKEYEDLEARAARFGEVAKGQVEALMARAEALEGCIRKRAGAYQNREQGLLDEIERLEQELHLCRFGLPHSSEPIEPASPIPGCR